MDKNDIFVALRQRYATFDYEAYHYQTADEGMHIWFDFRMGEHLFHPETYVDKRSFLNFGCDVDEVVFNIGMVEAVSYWKCACPRRMRVLCGSLSEEQVGFWKHLYWNGLGEFFYTNGICTTEEEFVSIEVAEGGQKKKEEKKERKKACEGYIVPVGGGKDSAVSLELLKGAGEEIRPLVMNPRGATTASCLAAGFEMEEVIVLRRKIDPLLLRLNSEGYLNGHTPFSAMLAFYTWLCSRLSGLKNVALSNESSANESTVSGSTVNHQYSKSLDFENRFRAYVRGVEGEGEETFRYFSFLRPLSELQIAMLFSRLRKYHAVFRSCNAGSKEDVWCGKCAKCLFACIILSPFLSPEEVDAIFGRRLLDDITLLPEMRQLCGLEETKPFECVGTVEEVRMALTMAEKRFYKAYRPRLMEEMSKAGVLHEAVGAEEMLRHIGREANLTEKEYEILKRACSEKMN